MVEGESAGKDAQVAATLAALAYLGPGRPPEQQFDMISGLLGERSLPTGKGWRIVWGPAELGGDLAYIAAAPRGGHAVVIRGTIVDNVFDLIQDAEVGEQRPLPFPSASFPAALISTGATGAWRNLSSMTSTLGDSPGSTILEFLRQLPSPFELLVTGHSLGGQLASVVAAWLQAALPPQPVRLVPITFAAPTAGNPAFAHEYDRVFDQATRYYSDLDVVPLLWTQDGLDRIKAMYSGGPRCQAACQLAVDAAQERIRNVVYAQTGNAAMLHSRLYSTTGFGSFEREVLDQHRPLLYMFILKVPARAIQLIDHNWQPPPDSVDHKD